MKQRLFVCAINTFILWNRRSVPYVLKDEIELDEKYFSYSHKGTKHPFVLGKKRGTPANKRGLSDEQVCLLTGVERFGQAILKAFNLAKPSSQDVLNIKNNIQQGSFVWTDGLSSYNDLITQQHCAHKTVKTKNDYDKVNHLNNVNNFHQRIGAQYTRYRGVATKYINRYAALFNIQRECSDMDSIEALLYIKRKLRKINDYFYIWQISKDDIFTCVPTHYALGF